MSNLHFLGSVHHALDLIIPSEPVLAVAAGPVGPASHEHEVPGVGGNKLHPGGLEGHVEYIAEIGQGFQGGKEHPFPGVFR